MMNSSEAYDILGVEHGASADDIKKAFKKQAAKLHPDVNKSDNAEDKFKKLNEAYQFLTSDKVFTDSNFASRAWGERFNTFNLDDFIHSDFFNSFFYKSTQLKARLQITFAESIKGIVKTVSYKRKNRCAECNGSCYVTIFDKTKKCDKCNGKGNRTYGDGEKEMPCTTCKATGHFRNKKQCDECNGLGSVEENHTTMVRIPSGVTSGTLIVLRGEGDFIGAKNQYTNAEVRIDVKTDADIKRQGRDLVSVVNISLLEALRGTTKNVRTIEGEKKLKITAPRKHGDQVIAQGLGVPPNGNHIFLLNVEYPKNLDKLIEYLQNSDDILNSKGE